MKIKQPSPDQFNILALLDEYINKMQSGGLGKAYAPSTVCLYKNARNHLAKFSSRAGEINLLQHSIDQYTSISDKRDVAGRFVGYFNKFSAYLSEVAKINVPTRHTVMNCVNIMISNIAKENYLSLPKIPVPKNKINPIFVLHPDMARKIVADEYGLYSGLTGDNRYAYEVICTILVTTMRVSDVISLKKTDIEQGHGEMFLLKMNKKTGSYTRIPLPQSLVSMFNANIKTYGDLYTPKTKKINLNEVIREVFRMIPDADNMVSIRTTNASGEEVVKTMPIHKAVRPHVLRKTAITTMIYNGLDDRHIKFASGHSHSSAAFERYVGFVEERFSSELNSYYNKIGI